MLNDQLSLMSTECTASKMMRKTLIVSYRTFSCVDLYRSVVVYKIHTTADCVRALCYNFRKTPTDRQFQMLMDSRPRDTCNNTEWS